MIETPMGVPVLAPGSHHGPREGACLMEYVAVLAGLPFDDHPSCTDPVLAAMARQVNDAVSDAARQRLVVLAPQLGAAQRVAPDRIEEMLERWASAAQQVAPGDLEAARAAAWIARRARWYRSGVTWGGLRRVYWLLAWLNRHPWRLDVALRRVARAVADHPDRDARLWTLLDGCVQQAQPHEPAQRTTLDPVQHGLPIG